MTARNILQAIKYLDSGESFLDIENYEKYRFSTEKIDCHHRRETDEGKTREQLIAEGLYYGVQASDLVFLTASEHAALHHKGKSLSEEHKKKMSESRIGRTLSDETRKKISESRIGKTTWNKGKTLSEEYKKKISQSMRGLRWYNDGQVNTRAKICPDGFTPGRI